MMPANRTTAFTKKLYLRLKKAFSKQKGEKELLIMVKVLG
jgi:hypothetical protein